ncbi:MAG: SPFH domain-containing protein [Nocardioidaceae bacterium]
MVLLIVLAVVVIVAIIVLFKTVRIVPQAYAGVVERFGKYRTTLSAGLNLVTPFVDRVRYQINLREQVVSFPPQPVITEDNLVVSIDTVIYFQVTNPVAATYEIENYIQAIEQLVMTTLRNIIGGMDLEQALTSRDEVNSRLRGVLDETTGRWGIRVNRVELKGIDPPPSIKDSMEKQMRADRDKRAVILTAEGMRQSQILTAEGQKQSSILTAEGERQATILRAQADRESRILRAQGEGQAILTVFQAIHDGSPDQALLAYQYLQMLPRIAEGDANKVWIVPSEIGRALEGLGSTLGSIKGIAPETSGSNRRVDYGAPVDADLPGGGGEHGALSSAHQEVAEAIASAEAAANPATSTHPHEPIPPAESGADDSVPEPAPDAAAPTIGSQASGSQGAEPGAPPADEAPSGEPPVGSQPQ